MMAKITAKEYNGLAKAFDHFNRELFGGSLPDCMITLHRKNGALGYFWAEQFSARNGEKKVDEIALNPSTFEGRTDREILSTLAHEMAHLWQQHNGNPGRGGYHNNEWADKMESIGLMPSDTAQEGGKRTGDRMSHYIVKGGAFSASCSRLLKSGYKIQAQARGEGVSARAALKRASKTKYTCPGCGLNAWGKPDILVACIECELPLEAEEKE